MKTIGQYRREHKAMCARVEQLEAELAARDAKTQAAIESAAAVAARVAAEEREQHERALAASEERCNLLRDTVTKLADRVDQLRRRTYDDEQRIEQLGAERDEWRDKAERAAPAIAAADAKVADLVVLLDKVRDRMRRKELDAERAILNRQVLAGATPGVNRR